jgi:hypothetical protein
MKILIRDVSSGENAKRAQTTRTDIFEGYGSPESVVTANRGAFYLNLNGGAGTTLYIKESGHNTNTGWVPAGSGGWSDEQIFTSTEGQTDFTITEFTFDANTQMTVYQNGLDVDEGASYEWQRNVALSKITFNDPLIANARIKVKKW